MTGRNPLRSACVAALAGGMMLLAGAAALALPAAAQGAVWHVDIDAPAGGDGTSWASAFRDLQVALAAAEGGDEVWIAEGTYRPTAGSDRTATFTLRSGLALYGGFDGTEATRDERDWTLHASVLSGELGDPDSFRDDTYHVVTANGVDAATVLDGLTIEHGSAFAEAPPDDRGGGLLAVGGSPAIRHCRFRGNVANEAGAAVYVEGGSPLVEDTAFEANVANGGSALYASGGAPVLRRVTFRDNGGNTLAFADGAGGLVEDALFEQNEGPNARVS